MRAHAARPCADLVGEHAYRLGALAGSGGFGVVFRGTQLATGRDVAIKRLAPPWTDERRARFTREARIARGIQHPNVVRALDFGHAPDGAPFIVFEWLEGRSLAAILEPGHGVPLEIAVHVGRELLSALGAIHASGIVHRDVKPSNVLLSTASPPRVSLLDLGVARPAVASRALTEDGAMVGSLPYMAPEQIDGEAVTPSADLYAVGLVLAEMIGGERIYRGAAVSICADKLRQPPPFSRVHWSSPLWPAIERATRARPDERPRSAEEMLALVGARRARSSAWPLRAVAIAVALLVAGVVCALTLGKGARARPHTSSAAPPFASSAGPITRPPTDLAPRACPAVDRLAAETVRAAFFPEGVEPTSGSRVLPGQAVDYWLTTDRQVTLFDFSTAGADGSTPAELLEIQSRSATESGRIALRGATRLLVVAAPSSVVEAFERRHCP